MPADLGLTRFLRLHRLRTTTGREPMLVITRRFGESVQIGDNIVIKLLPVKGSRAVRLAIEAPRELKIVRKEIACATKK